MALAPTLDLSLATSRIRNLLGREGYTPSVFFCLDSCMGKILTGDYLRRRGFTIVWIGVASASVVGRILITSCCTVGRFLSSGVLLLDRFVLLGIYPRGLLIYW